MTFCNFACHQKHAFRILRPRSAAPRGAVAAVLETAQATGPAPPAPVCNDGKDVDEVDVIVIGAGIGGLCCASLLAKYGLQVAVIESHRVPGGAAHHWSRQGYEFDSGAALFSGLTPNADGSVSENPLNSVLEALGERVDCVLLDDRATCLVYPDGRQYRTQIGSKGFVGVVRDRWGAAAAEEWDRFQQQVGRMQDTAGAVPPFAVRLDSAVGLTAAARKPLRFLRYLLGSVSMNGASFGDIMNRTVTNPDVKALINLISMGTCSVPPADIDASYMTRAFNEMWSQRTQLQYPKGGSQALVDALVRGLCRCGGHLMLRSPVAEVMVRPDDPSSCTGVRLESGRVIRSRKAVVSNASVWDTARFLPGASVLPDFAQYHAALEMNDSMLHLHVAFRAREGEDLPMHTYFLESEHTGDNGWPTIVIPSVPDPDLAPPGHHVLHATMSEPFAPWQHLDRASSAYAALKKRRAAVLWSLVREIIPDIDDRVTVSFVGTPRSHQRFLNRSKGAYGPRNLLTLTGMLPVAVKPLTNMFCVGDTVFPGVGTPAVAASGMWVANTLVPVAEHWRLMDQCRI